MASLVHLTRAYAVLRSQLGRQPQFCEQGPELCDSIPEEPAERHHYGLRNPVHRATQHAPALAVHRVNTERVELAAAGVNHEEGGWPREISCHDPDSTHRYRHKVEREDNYLHCIQNLGPIMEHYVLQNNAIDVYDSYYARMEPPPAAERLSCRTVNAYRDPHAGSRRAVSSVCWQPFGRRFAVAYADVPFERAPRGPLDAFVWSADNPAAPDVTVGTPAPLLDLQFSPRDADVLAGALLSGQVGAWDARAPARPVALSAPHLAHRDLARRVRFVHSKSGTEVFSAGPDGAVKWWDLRNLAALLDEMIMEPVRGPAAEPSRARAHGVSALEYEHTIPARFMVGTEDGLVLGANRKGKTAQERLPVVVEAHVGPVWSVERNPWFPKSFLTVGDWKVRVWSEECRDSAVLWTAPQRHRTTAAVWSPTRGSVVAATRWDGALCVWDLLRRHDAPSLAAPVCAEPLLTLQMHRKGSLVACGSRAGHVYLVEVSHSLALPDKNDKSLLAMVVARETHRERILEARVRELRLRQRQAEEGVAAAGSASTLLATDADLADVTADYLAQVKKEHAKIAF